MSQTSTVIREGTILERENVPHDARLKLEDSIKGFSAQK